MSKWSKETPPWYSLTGYLWMKHLGGAWLALRPRRRYFFALDEVSAHLVFFSDESSYTKEKDPVGSLPIGNSAVSLADHSTAFIVHIDDRKRVELEAESSESCECWLQALARRSSGKKERCQSLPSESDRVDSPLRRKLTLPPAIEGANDEHATLSMLEERLRILVDNECNHLPERKIRTRSVPAAPVWLDDWVNNWLQQQPFNAHGDSDSSAVMDASIESSTTSPCDTGDCSTVSSENALVDELSTMRSIVNRQKSELERARTEKELLTREVMEYRLREEATSHTERNNFLNAEVVRLNQRCREAEASLEETRLQLSRTREENQQLRREYASALQAAIRVPISDHHSVDVLQVRLYGGDLRTQHKRRVCLLIEEARRDNPSLPTLHSLICGIYVDEYGFRISFTDEALAVHYLACRLQEHYEDRLEGSVEHRQRWSLFLEQNTTIPLSKETRQLVRGGIPASLRSAVWKILIQQQVIAAKIHHGKYYYRNLCSMNGGDADRTFCANHQKQVNLDLLRTMPSNVHFMNAGCKGVSQLQQVLRAFCLHNGSTGYCQGMNFLAATALLVVGAEDAFWLLVALTESFFHQSYFDEALSGAQADQEVLKELLEQKLPQLTKHLEECEIDLATMTLNWFIAIFFDAVPFKTLLRFWDSFLLEGPKVLFRFSIALLSFHVDEILQKTDTIGVMKVVKAAVRLSYDVDGLFKLAFEDFNHFPSRAQLRSKQMGYLEILRARLSQRSVLRGILREDSECSSSRRDSAPICDLSIHNEGGRGIIIAGNNQAGRVSTIDLRTQRMDKLSLEWDCRAVSVVMAGESLAFVSLLSGYLVSLDISSSPRVLWELKLADVALRLLFSDGRVIGCLANGSLTVIELSSSSSSPGPSSLELLHLPIGSAPILDAAVDDEHIWLALACKLICLNKETFSHISSVYVACSGTCTGTPFFDKIVCLAASPHGVFVATTQSTLLQLWNGPRCSLLFDISTDHDHRKPSLMDAEEKKEMHISSLLYSQGSLWTGTSDGYIIIYQVVAQPDNKAEHGAYALHKYPPGTRLSAETSPGGVRGRQGQYYIPTREETSHGNEFPDKEKFRFTVHIDKDSNEYSVVPRSAHNSSGFEEGPSSSTMNANEVRRSNSSRVVRKESACSSRISRRRGLPKGLSVDSAVSVFSSEQQPRVPVPRQNGFFLSRMACVDPSTASSLSMDYDDLFELYSEESRHPRSRLVGECSDCTIEDGQSNGERLCPSCRWISFGRRRHHSDSARPRLRRRDLEEDDAMVVAVKADDRVEGGETQAVDSSIGLNLLMKMKISDSAVCKIIDVTVNDERLVVTCAGDYGEEEGVLRWRRERESDLWINDPVQDPTSTRRLSRIPSSTASPPPSS